ncbi:MAG: hypothetical protein WD489_05615 [Rhodovibrionaceae bacterium]
MAKGFLLLLIAVAAFGFFAVDISALGGDTVFNWLCPDSWGRCRAAGDFLRRMGP